MTLEVFTDEQGSEAWHRARLGLPTASEYHTLLAKGRDGGASKTRLKYLRRLAGEIITGELEETYRNADMERGNAMEAEARAYYAFKTGAEIERVGFIKNGRTGCSPDALIGEDGLLEIKTCIPSVLIEHVCRGTYPPEHRPQGQGGLLVTGRKWVDICCYWPTMPKPFIVRETRDEEYIGEIVAAVDRFNEELDLLVAKVRRALGAPSTLAADLRASAEAA